MVNQNTREEIEAIKIRKLAIQYELSNDLFFLVKLFKKSKTILTRHGFINTHTKELLKGIEKYSDTEEKFKWYIS